MKRPRGGQLQPNCNVNVVRQQEGVRGFSAVCFDIVPSNKPLPTWSATQRQQSWATEQDERDDTSLERPSSQCPLMVDDIKTLHSPTCRRTLHV